MNYPEIVIRKRSLRNQEVSPQTRTHLRRTFTDAYQSDRRTKGIWTAIFLFLFALLALLPVYALLLARFGK